MCLVFSGLDVQPKLLYLQSPLFGQVEVLGHWTVKNESIENVYSRIPENELWR